MARRGYPRVTNSELAIRQERLETDMQGLKEDMKGIRNEIAPIHTTLLQVQGVIKLAGIAAGLLSFVGTAVTIWMAMRH